MISAPILGAVRPLSNCLAPKRRWYNYLSQYWAVSPHSSLPEASVGLTIAEALLAPRCILYERKEQPLQVAGAAPPPPRSLSTWPLSNWFFYTRYSFTGFDRPFQTSGRLQNLPHATLMPPVVVHYNWAVTLLEKVGLMRENGHWFSDIPL